MAIHLHWLGGLSALHLPATMPGAHQSTGDEVCIHAAKKVLHCPLSSESSPYLKPLLGVYISGWLMVACNQHSFCGSTCSLPARQISRREGCWLRAGVHWWREHRAASPAAHWPPPSPSHLAQGETSWWPREPKQEMQGGHSPRRYQTHRRLALACTRPCKLRALCHVGHASSLQPWRHA